MTLISAYIDYSSGENSGGKCPGGNVGIPTYTYRETEEGVRREGALEGAGEEGRRGEGERGLRAGGERGRGGQ